MTRDLREDRDEQLGAALRRLDVPEHRPAFFDELDRLLADETTGTPLGRSARERWFPGRRFRLAAAALAVAAAALAVGIPLTGRTGGPDTASAAEIKAELRSSLASVRNWSGVFVFSCGERDLCPPGGTSRWRFTISSEGDVRLTGPTGRESIVYDASSGVFRSAQRSASAGGDTIFYAERTGVAPGPPDSWLLASEFDEFGAFVRALLAANDPRVRETTYEGRPAWALVAEAVPNAIVPEYTGDVFEITVDRETGMPVRVVERKGGVLLREMRVEKMTVNRELAPDTFRLAFPARSDVSRTDDGFRQVRLHEVAAAVGYAPLVPAWLPDGYELAEVATARVGQPTGREAGNPPSRGVVSLSYRRGLDQLIVTTRLRGSGRWSDPLATGEGYVDDPERIVLRRGALSGARAELLLVPRGIPHVWALGDRLVLTVAGDASRAELLRVAESLEPRG